jgi:glycolate oxidase FAD binding subunit
MTSPVPPELARACAHVHPARPGDAVAGRPARFVAEPASTEEAAALLRAAAELGLSVVPRGTGTRLTWGLPPGSCDLIVDTGRLTAVLEHAAGDLVVRVQAGARLDDLQAKLAAEGQRLALDPPGGGTIGGIVATNAAGPLRFRFGAPRDLLIGITVIRADGTVAKAGGKVVKNVAGYDLGKLFAGSYGTLGLIAEATFRLHPLPAASAWVTTECPDAARAAEAVHAMASSPLAPSAVELDWPSAAAQISVATLIEGDEASVDERCGRMRGLLSERGLAEPRSAQGERADRDIGHATLIRTAFWARELETVLRLVRAVAREQGLDPSVSGAAGSGVLHVAVPGGVPVTSADRFVAGLRDGLVKPADVMPDASAVVLDAPAEVRDVVDMWGPVPSVQLMRAVKDQFDPEHRLAPGRFTGGI